MDYEIKFSLLCWLSPLHPTHRNATLRSPPIKELKTVFQVLYTTRISLYPKFPGTQRTGVNQQNFSREKAWSSLLSQAIQSAHENKAAYRTETETVSGSRSEGRIRIYFWHQCAGLSKYCSCSLKTSEANQTSFGQSEKWYLHQNKKTDF